jgi:hypothetical protein
MATPNKPEPKVPAMTPEQAQRESADYEKKTQSASTTKKDMGEGKPDPIGYVKKALGMNSGGSVGSASKRADGIAQRGKTKGRVC